MKMKLILKIAMVLFILTSALALEAESNAAWKTNFKQALEEAKKKDLPVFVDVHAEWCTYCKKLKTDVYPAEEFKTETKNFIKVTIDGEKDQEFYEHYNINGFPTLLFLDKNGAEIDRISGFTSVAILTKKLKDVYKRKNYEQDVLTELKANPDSVIANFKVGVYYSDLKDHTRARMYFLKAWNSPANDSPSKKEDSIYNAAVSSMELKDYILAISYWNAFLGVHNKKDGEYARARFYRGLSYKNLGKRSLGKEDFGYSIEHLPTIQERRAAEKIFKN